MEVAPSGGEEKRSAAAPYVASQRDNSSVARKQQAYMTCSCIARDHVLVHVSSSSQPSHMCTAPHATST
jgi:hypothetical protein